MTQQNDITDNTNYVLVHNAGFVGLVDFMGTDLSICEAARVSHAKSNTSNLKNDRALLRYLMRQRHTSPFEMCEMKFHIKLPIFVMRQLIRHRTASVNEYSARGSEMMNEFYSPVLEYVQPQSDTNKQGRSDRKWCDKYKERIVRYIDACCKDSYLDYADLLGCARSPIFEEGLTKELARIVLPVAIYTECYWKMDLHNLFHLLKLRLDPNAQVEIRDYAKAMYGFVKAYFPLSSEAFEDYILQSRTLSRMDIQMLSDENTFGIVGEAEDYEMSKREYEEMKEFIRNLRQRSVPEYILKHL